MSAGGAIEGTRAVLNNEVDSAFCLQIIRPPGHHASCQNAAGFCFFNIASISNKSKSLNKFLKQLFYNNAAVAARYAQKEFGIKKVAIFDWDVHVGDGTSDVFYEDDSVLYMSIHRFDNGGFYPGPAGKHNKVGDHKGRGYITKQIKYTIHYILLDYNIHFPFNVEKNHKNLVGDTDYIYAVEQVFIPLIKEFQPEFFIISAELQNNTLDHSIQQIAKMYVKADINRMINLILKLIDLLRQILSVVQIIQTYIHNL